MKGNQSGVDKKSAAFSGKKSGGMSYAKHPAPSPKGRQSGGTVRGNPCGASKY